MKVKELHTEIQEINEKILALKMRKAEIKKVLKPVNCINIPMVEPLERISTGFEVVLWAGETYGDVEFEDVGSYRTKAEIAFCKQIKLFDGDRAITLREWFSDGSSEDVKNWEIPK